MNRIEIRRMAPEDIDSVLEVEVRSFTTPWSRATFEAEIIDNELAHYLVVTGDGQVIGYGGMWLVVDEAHVTNIAILPEYRSKGLGGKLLAAMVSYAKDHGMESMTLEVRVGNIVARRLYSRFGFVARGLRKNYYTDNHEDALIMWRYQL